MADLTFYSSVRRGAALGITRKAAGARSAGGTTPGCRSPSTTDGTRGKRRCRSSVLATSSGSTPAASVRTFPRADDNDAEDAFLCYADFNQVDLPWRYTPSHYTQVQHLGRLGSRSSLADPAGLRRGD